MSDDFTAIICSITVITFLKHILNMYSKHIYQKLKLVLIIKTNNIFYILVVFTHILIITQIYLKFKQ